MFTPLKYSLTYEQYILSEQSCQSYYFTIMEYIPK